MQFKVMVDRALVQHSQIAVSLVGMIKRTLVDRHSCFFAVGFSLFKAEHLKKVFFYD